MRPLLLAMALVLPASVAATVAMEPQQAIQPQDAGQPGQATRSGQAGAGAHPPLFIVKYVLRRAPPDHVPPIVLDDPRPQIVPPGAGDYPTATLGTLQRDPNKVICYGRGCEYRP
jgi:hypothetical protein